MTLSGKCLCEAVTYEVRGPSRGVVNCHCSRCRRHTGHFMAATQAATDDVVISGNSLTWYDATVEVQYGFCAICGSTMFWRTTARPDRLSIAAGTLTPPTGLETIGTIYRNYASDYHVFDESVPNHGEDFSEIR